MSLLDKVGEDTVRLALAGINKMLANETLLDAEKAAMADVLQKVEAAEDHGIDAMEAMLKRVIDYAVEKVKTVRVVNSIEDRS